MTNLYEQVLYDYQKKLVDESNRNKKYAFWAEPGLGKTFMSLSVVQRREKKKVMVVCQSSKVSDWREDIEKHLEYETIGFQAGPKKDKDNFDDLEEHWMDGFSKGFAIVTSFQTFWRRDFMLKYLNDDYIVIIDESQYLKSKKSSVGKYGVKVSNKVSDMLLLSGTPINKYEDYYNQLVMLGMDMKYKDFEERFCETKEIKLPTSRWPFKVITGYRDIDLLLEAVRSQSTFLKTIDAIDLPDKIFTDILLNHEKKTIYDKVKKLQVYKDIEIASAGVLYNYLRQFASGFLKEYKLISNHKKEALNDLFETNKNNFIVFYNFKQELEDIKEIALAHDIKVFEFNGEVKNGYDAKTYNGRYIIASQYQSAAEGLNLQFANNQLYYSPPMSFMKYKQSQARVHRVGQVQNVFYYRFITNGTVEEKMYHALELGKSYDEKSFENDYNKGEK